MKNFIETIKALVKNKQVLLIGGVGTLVVAVVIVGAIIMVRKNNNSEKSPTTSSIKISDETKPSKKVAKKTTKKKKKKKKTSKKTTSKKISTTTNTSNPTETDNDSDEDNTSSDTPEETLTATTISIVSGDDQTAGFNETLAKFTVKVKDQNGDAISDVTVKFSILSVPSGASGQSLSATSVKTSSSGQSSTYLTLGDKEGTYTVKASVSGISSYKTFSAIIVDYSLAAPTVTVTGGTVVSGYINSTNTGVKVAGTVSDNGEATITINGSAISASDISSVLSGTKNSDGTIAATSSGFFDVTLSKSAFGSSGDKSIRILEGQFGPSSAVTLTADFVAPTVSISSATASTQTIVLQFSESMAGSLTDKTQYQLSKDGMSFTQVSASGSSAIYNSGTYRVTLVVSDDFDFSAGDSITVMIEAGGAIYDVAGNGLEDNSEFGYYISDSKQAI